MQPGGKAAKLEARLRLRNPKICHQGVQGSGRRASGNRIELQPR